MNIKKILHPTDFSPCSSLALSHAVFYAEIFGAELHILHSVTWKDQKPRELLPDADTIREKLEESARVRLKEMLPDAHDKPFRIIEKMVLENLVSDAILEYVDKESMDLIIMGTHGRRGMKHFLMGSVAEETVRRSPVPVMTVREHKDAGLRSIEKIMVAVDFSKHSQLAVRRAEELAMLHAADLHLVHIVEDFYLPSGFGKTTSLPDEFTANLRKQRAKDLQELKQVLAEKDLNVEVHLSEGRRTLEMNRIIDEEKMDLLVMGTHGFQGFNHVLLGSTAEQMIRTAKCPVLTVHLKKQEKAE